jgi:hypothetical protein
MEQDVIEARAAGAKGQGAVIEVQVGQEAAIWVMGFALMTMMVMRMDLWAPYVTDVLVFMGV